MPARDPDPHSLGGQALREGVMLRSRRWWSVAVRRPDGGLHVESHRVGDLARRRPWLDQPLLRGAIALAEAMSIGLRALEIATRHSSSGPQQPSQGRVRRPLAGAIAFLVLLFVVAPALVVPGTGASSHAAEGALRVGVLVGYVLAISRIAEIRRVFGYHGAEHKVVAAVEAGAPRTAEGVAPFPTIHVRCGTNFLVLVMIVSSLLFAVVDRDPLWWRLSGRVLLTPVAAAATYEILRAAARRPGNPLVRLVSWPGRAMQRITTRQPEPDQVEVALAAMEELLARHDDPGPPPDTP